MPGHIEKVPQNRHDHAVAEKVISSYTRRRLLALDMYEDRYGNYACRATLKGKAEPFFCQFQDNAIQEENLEEVAFNTWPPTSFGEAAMDIELKSRFDEAIEAYGVKGMENKRWRKYFKSTEALDKWVEANDAEIQGTRTVSNREAGIKEAEQRRSDKPLKAHADVVDKYAEVLAMQEKLQEQSLAIQAIVKEKGNMADALAAEIEKFAAEYENQTIRTKKIVAKLEEIPAAKSKSVSWKKYIDWSLGKFQTISAELHKEAQDFLEATKQMIPSKKFITTQKVESICEGVEDFIAGLTAKLSRTAKKIDDLEAVVKKID